MRYGRYGRIDIREATSAQMSSTALCCFFPSSCSVPDFFSQMLLSSVLRQNPALFVLVLVVIWVPLTDDEKLV